MKIWLLALARVTTVVAMAGLLIALVVFLQGCGGASDVGLEDCPKITAQNIAHAMPAPAGSACAQILVSDEYIARCGMPVDPTQGVTNNCPLGTP
jgi:hypothetical protein